jgi:hypothetical protein
LKGRGFSRALDFAFDFALEVMESLPPPAPARKSGASARVKPLQDSPFIPNRAEGPMRNLLLTFKRNFGIPPQAKLEGTPSN